MQSLERHLLVTVSEDIASSLSLSFISGFFSAQARPTITLFYVAPRPRTHLDFGDELRNPEILAEIEAHKQKQAPKALTEAKTWLLTMGFAESRIHTKITPTKNGIATDIINEGEEGLYDAVVLGRRGLSWIETMFTDSVSRTLILRDCSFPIWICRAPQRGHRGVLVCVDGSEGSLSAVDHVGFMLREDPRHQITLLNVRESGEALADTGGFYREALAILAGHEVPENRIAVKSVAAKKASQAIVHEIKQASYAAVAMGRGKPSADALGRVIGSTSSYVLRNAGDCAIWLTT